MSDKPVDITPDTILNAMRGKTVKTVTQDDAHTVIIEFEEGFVFKISSFKKEILEWYYGTVEAASRAPDGW